jgi:outer membrane protein assembly factor BamB
VVSGSVIWIQSGIIYAVNIADGKILWRAGLGGTVQGAPVVAEGVIYLASMEGDIYALE